MTTASIRATCTYNNKWIPCESPVPPSTKAVLECQTISYQPETNLLTGQRRDVSCNENGQWEPEPMRCIAGPLINIYINNTKLKFHPTFNRNATFIEVLDDRVIIYTNTNNPNIDIRVSKSNNDVATDEPWAWS